MGMPEGLRKPHRIAELAPPVAVLIGVAVAAYYAFLHLTQMGWPGLPSG